MTAHRPTPGAGAPDPVREAIRVPADLLLLSSAATPGPWFARNNTKGTPWIGDHPTDQHAMVIVQKLSMYRGWADYAFVAGLVTWFRDWCADRAVDRTVSEMETVVGAAEAMIRRVEAALLCDLKDEVRARFVREFAERLAAARPAGTGDGR